MKNYLIVGKQGSGKTILVNNLIKNVIKQKRKVIILDFNYEYKVPHYSLSDLYESNQNFKVIAISILPENFDTLCLILLNKYKHITFVIDELDLFDSSNPLSNSDNFKQLLHIGRHKDISLVGITRRCHEISRLFTSQIRGLFCFRTTEPRDLKYLLNLSNNIDYIQVIRKLKLYHWAYTNI